MNFLTKKILSSVCCGALAFTLVLPNAVPAKASTPESTTTRIYGTTLYDTAAEISMAGWTSAPAVVLATGQRFPDALAGTVLAHQVGGPLLLTESNQLTPSVLTELQRLGHPKIYILGGTSAVSASIKTDLENRGYVTQRIYGNDQYDTSAAIAKEAFPSGSQTQAFLVNGDLFPDALSISSYAAAQGIPILMTRTSSVPASTIDAMAQLGVQKVTLIGGTSVISDAIQKQLQSLPKPITVADRLYGYDKYATNAKILNTLSFDTSSVYVATGENFPDALAGSALAALNNHPILLVPPDQLSTASATMSYLTDKRTAGSAFTIFGGWGVLSYHTESIIRTGVLQPRVSLQYAQGSFAGMTSELASIPSPATDYADIISPSWYYLNPDGSVSSTWDTTPNNFTQFVSSVHSRDLKVIPMISSSSSSVTDTVLTSASIRANLENQIVQRIQAIGADGIDIDFEVMSDSTGPYLTLFMQELYAKLHPMNKLVIMAVMSRNKDTTWNNEFNYPDLAQAVDFLNIMTYDYKTSTPGPIAPIDWINSVLTYTQGQGVDMHKVLMGIPYYGRDWWPDIKNPGTFVQQSRGLYNIGDVSTPSGIYGAMDRLATFHATLLRDSSDIPYFTYIDSSNATHTVYFDDAVSLNRKLALLDQYGLGGIGAWSLYWITNPDAANQILPLLKQHLR